MCRLSVFFLGLNTSVIQHNYLGKKLTAKDHDNNKYGLCDNSKNENFTDFFKRIEQGLKRYAV